MDSAGARYADGKSAKILVVSVSPTQDGLSITDEVGQTVALWPYDEIRLIGGRRSGQPNALRLLSDEAARLTLDDDAFLPRLASLAPDLNKDGIRDPRQWRRALVWTVGLVLLFGGLGFGVSSSAPLVAALLPMSVEEQLGKATLEQVVVLFGGFGESGDKMCRGRAGRRALDTLTARLKAVDDSPYVFKVKVVDISIPNAFAAPGGYIVIFRGLLDLAESPDEITGVLGHEMAHVTQRHVTTNMIRSMGFQALLVPLISGGTAASDLISGLGQMALQASYTREAEAEADLASVELLRRAGIRAGTFPQLLLRLERKYGMGGSDDEPESGEEDSKGAQSDRDSFSIPDILASHPATPDRAATVAAAAGTGGGPSMSDEDWQALRTICSRR